MGKMIGFGATLSKLNALVHSYNLQCQLQKLKNEAKELKAIFQKKKNNTDVEQEENVSEYFVLTVTLEYIFLIC